VHHHDWSSPTGGEGFHDIGNPAPPDHGEVAPVFHIDHLSIIAAHQIDVTPAAPADGHDHGLLSTAKDTGWLSPTSPLAAVAGTALAGGLGLRMRRRAGARTEELRERVERGERVVVALDADRIHRALDTGDRLSEAGGIPGQGAERPFEVVAVRADGPSGASVVVDDGGRRLGRREIPLALFEDAWETGGRTVLEDEQR
jgi:hypothetical protein